MAVDEVPGKFRAYLALTCHGGLEPHLNNENHDNVNCCQTCSMSMDRCKRAGILLAPSGNMVP